MTGRIQCDVVEGIRGLARKGALADHRGARCRSTGVRVTGTHWVPQGIAMDSAGPP